MENHYEILGVEYNALPDIIKKRYRELAKELHPDVNPSKETEERFKKINAAYEILSNPAKRREYDTVWQNYLKAKTYTYFSKQFKSTVWNSTAIIVALLSVVVIVTSLLYLSNKKNALTN